MPMWERVAPPAAETLLIEHSASKHKRRSGIRPDRRAADLPDAVGLLLGG